MQLDEGLVEFCEDSDDFGDGVGGAVVFFFFILFFNFLVVFMTLQFWSWFFSSALMCVLFA